MPRTDTSRDARGVQRAAQRRLGAARRVELAFEMSEQARTVSIQGAMARDRSLSHAEARARVLRRLLGGALADTVWPLRARE